jgi:hypothetical protein
VDGWLGARPTDRLAHIATVALDPGVGTPTRWPAGLATPGWWWTISTPSGWPATVADQVRRRVQQATLGHRGRTHDPLYRIRKLLLIATEQLTQQGRARLGAGPAAGDPSGEVVAAWQGKELLRAVYRAIGLPAAPVPRSTGSTAGQMASRSRAVPAWLAP